jgi:hypothetical protein
VISRATRSFWQAYEQLNKAQKKAARRTFTLFLENPGHNSLQYNVRVAFNRKVDNGL